MVLVTFVVFPRVYPAPSYSHDQRTHQYLQVEAQNHRFSYNEPIRVEALTQGICDLALNFAEVRMDG